MRLKNKNFSLISSNCNGACILHDLCLPFNSPFVDLWIKPDDYIKMLTSLSTYMNKQLVFIKEKDINYPIACIDDVKIYFQHYKSESEALEKWETRKKRINYDNLFILFTDRDGCTYKNICDFDSLPFKNKVVFTNKKYKDVRSAFYIKGFEKEESVGMLMDKMVTKPYKKYYDQFNYVKWFNGHYS